MNELIKRWQALAPREQWLVYLVGLAAIAMLYTTLVADPLSQRTATFETQRRLAEDREQQARAALAELQARHAEDPDAATRQALINANAEQATLMGRIDGATRTLVSPAEMKALLQELLRRQTGLALVSMESFSEPLSLPGGESGATTSEPSPAPMLYRHGLRLTLQGGYFDLVRYLEAIRDSGWRLHWDNLDYQVGEDGPGQARVRLELHTLSRDAGWVGV